MLQAVYTGTTGLNASQTLLDATGNNLANTNTTGFKTSEVGFEDLIYANLSPPGGTAFDDQFLPGSVQVGVGTALASTASIFTQGPIQQTGDTLDVAIQGNGLFQVALPDGTTGYTRDGAFQLDGNGRLVTQDGNLVIPTITIPPGSRSITISADGTVTALTPDSPNVPVRLGQLTLARFVNTAGLLRVGDNTFIEGPASGPAVVATPGQNGLGTLRQGALEGSNVNVTTELVNLLIAQRSFSFNAEAIRISAEMLQSAAELL
jgi:flagellar basal-body rod protein FlgG